MTDVGRMPACAARYARRRWPAGARPLRATRCARPKSGVVVAVTAVVFGIVIIVILIAVVVVIVVVIVVVM